MLVLFLPYCLFGDYWGGLVAVGKIYHWKSVGKWLGENGMNGACEMEMSISRSRAVLRCVK